MGLPVRTTAAAAPSAKEVEVLGVCVGSASQSGPVWRREACSTTDLEVVSSFFDAEKPTYATARLHMSYTFEAISRERVLKKERKKERKKKKKKAQ